MVKNIHISDYDYPLPDERIARHPLAQRDACRLLVSTAPGECRHERFSALPGLLPEGSLLVRNNTRVINARMRFEKTTGSKIEIFLLEPIEPQDYVLTFQTTRCCRWSCLVGNLKRWKEGALEKRLEIAGREVTLRALRGESLPGNAHDIEFSWDDPSATFADIVEAAGYIPIPPYLKRDSEASDSDDYQTVYARIKGSVAAPTAGLHFTTELLGELEAKGVVFGNVTLHVGAGTFQPVKSEQIGDHPMHTEVFSVERSLVESLIDAISAGRQVTAVGTTSVRTLESLPYLGRHLMAGDGVETVSQWEAYETTLEGEALKEDTLAALRAILARMDAEGTDSLTASTSIMIAPGFRWRIVDAMVTNFHQPSSTLLLLVASFLGDGPEDTAPRWRQLYDAALAEDYRFLSYGDACYFKRTLIMGEVEITLPGSKSIAARALILDRVYGLGLNFENMPDCDDTVELSRALAAFPAEGETHTSTDHVYNLGAGGTSLRFFIALAASTPGFEGVIDCAEQLRRRPLKPLIAALSMSGADITPIGERDEIPYRVCGRRLCGWGVEVESSMSSQFASALLMVQPLWSEPCQLDLENATSQPYIAMTRRMIAEFDEMNRRGERGSTYKIEGDWSAAAFFYEYRLSRPECVIRFSDLTPPAESLQGDAACDAVFRAVMAADPDRVVAFDMRETPDMVPALAVGLCVARRRFRLTGVASLRYKESDRVDAICTALRQLGYRVTAGDDSIEWKGDYAEPRRDAPIKIDSRHDHRIAMAFAVAALLLPYEVEIIDPEAVTKSFPDFFNQLSKLR